MSSRVLKWEVSKIFYKNYSANTDLVINRGGTSSTKTYSLAQLFITYLITEPDKKMLISRKYNSTMKLTVTADFMQILKDSGIYEQGIYHKTDKTFLYPPTGSVIYLTGVDEPQKLKGTNFNYVWLNEADEFSHEDFTQLYLRLRRRSKDNRTNKMYLDFNPSDAYTWIRTKLEDKGKGTLIHSTYKDNPFLDEATVRKIRELEETDSTFFKIYGLGEYDTIQGLIYENYELVDAMPEAPKWVVYGLDFGFTNDATALVRACYYDGAIWVEELIYNTGLLNSDIVAKMRQEGLTVKDEIFADSAEPKSIEEIYRQRFNIKPCKKGKDSIMHGIQLLKQYPLKICKNSPNLIKEIRAYKWAEDKNGNSLNKPVDKFNHALDALRYAVTMKIERPGKGLKIYKSY